MHIKRIGKRLAGGYVPSLKNPAPTIYYRHSERDFIYLLEADPSVQRFERFPYSVFASQDGSHREHWVGFKVYTRSRIIFADVAEKATEPEWLHDAKSEANARGGSYALVPHSSVRAEPRLSNAKAIVRNHALPPSENFLLSLKQSLSGRMRTIGELEHELSSFGDTRRLILSAAARREVQLDLSHALGADTGVSL